MNRASVSLTLLSAKLKGCIDGKFATRTKNSCNPPDQFFENVKYAFGTLKFKIASLSWIAISTGVTFVDLPK
jgi:hypothetical protein